MTTFDEEFLEVFGNKETYKAYVDKISKIIEPTLNEECKHQSTFKSPDGTIICDDCDECIDECNHENSYEGENGFYICEDCGFEVEVLNFQPEWKYYGSSNGYNKDQSRCHKERGSEKNLDKIFDNLPDKISKAIKSCVEKKYYKIVGTDTVRGKKRESIVAACLFHVYQDFGEARTSDYIRTLFDIKKKKMSQGLNDYYRTFPKDRVKLVKTEHLIKWLMTLTGINRSHYKNIINVCRYFNNTARTLKRSSPQSVAASIIYFYLCWNKKYKSELGLTKSQFAQKAMLSDITITKLTKEMLCISKSSFTV